MRLDEAEACASVAEEDGAAEALVEALAEGVADEELCAVELRRSIFRKDYTAPGGSAPKGYHAKLGKYLDFKDCIFITFENKEQVLLGVNLHMREMYIFR